MYLEAAIQMRRNKAYLTAQIQDTPLPAALSVILTEMFFRSRLRRYVEYAAWLVLWALPFKKISTLTVGVAQLQLQHWYNLGFISSFTPSLTNLLTVSNVNNNYHACVEFLRINDCLAPFDSIKIADVYTGNARKYYVQILRFAFNNAASPNQR